MVGRVYVQMSCDLRGTAEGGITHQRGQLYGSTAFAGVQAPRLEGPPAGLVLCSGYVRQGALLSYIS